LILALGCLALLAWLPWRWLQDWWLQPGPAAPAQTFIVPPGSSMAEVAALLSDRGLLSRPALWRAAARWQSLDGQIKQGEYRVSDPVSPAALLALLVAGEVVEYQLTLPEGITLAQALVILHSSEGLTATLEGPDAPALLALVDPHPSAEGWFFPDSYRYTRGDTDLAVLEQAHRRMTRMLAELWQARTMALPYDTPYEALIMASIVERETGLAAERDAIAGVFVRRLERGMRLQTDPTVIYGLGATFDGNLRRVHLADETNPYNSYRHHGLPPTPIALPGRAAIEAALNPLQGSALYFVARGDGSHVFSDTLEQHNAAVRAYQLQRAENYRSAPPTDGEG
jgi:UPF0755 protein